MVRFHHSAEACGVSRAQLLTWKVVREDVVDLKKKISKVKEDLEKRKRLPPC